MQSLDKRLLVVDHNQNLLQRTVDIASATGITTVLSLEADFREPIPDGIEVIYDKNNDRGPFSAARDYAIGSEANWLLVTAVDMPGLQTEILNFLLATAKMASDEVVAIVPYTNQNHYMCALYRRTALVQCDPHINSFYKFLATLAPDKIHIADGCATIEPLLWERAFLNINKPDDWHAWQKQQASITNQID